MGVIELLTVLPTENKGHMVRPLGSLGLPPAFMLAII